MLSLLTNNDPIMIGPDSAMDNVDNNNQPLNDAFTPGSLYTCKGTDNLTLKSLLASPSRPHYQVATADTTSVPEYLR